MQSNAVIWVEGPSDRIYIRHWIKSVAPELVEGIHYTIMFYGGRLLSHLSADAEEVADFIGLRSLNQNLAVVIDSDKSSAHKHINATKKRVQNELAEGQSIAWITKGCEIENYVPHDLLQSAVSEIYASSYGKPYGGGPYDHALHFHPKGGGAVVTSIDKVRVAREVAKGEADLSVLDLDERITELVKMIRAANSD